MSGLSISGFSSRGLTSARNSSRVSGLSDEARGEFLVSGEQRGVSHARGEQGFGGEEGGGGGGRRVSTLFLWEQQCSDTDRKSP